MFSVGNTFGFISVSLIPEDVENTPHSFDLGAQSSTSYKATPGLGMEAGKGLLINYGEGGGL